MEEKTKSVVHMLSCDTEEVSIVSRLTAFWLSICPALSSCSCSYHTVLVQRMVRAKEISAVSSLSFLVLIAEEN